MILILAKGTSTEEPRTHISPDDPLKSPYMFGLTVDGMKPGARGHRRQGVRLARTQRQRPANPATTRCRRC